MAERAIASEERPMTDNSNAALRERAALVDALVARLEVTK
jgi:hypothetical protein